MMPWKPGGTRCTGLQHPSPTGSMPPQRKPGKMGLRDGYVLWGRFGEVVKQYCMKGSELMVEGRITTRAWEDKTGAKRYTTEIVDENIQLGGRPGAGKAAEREAEAVEAARGDGEEMKQEDLPF